MSTVITSLKNPFARHGIPDTLYSDIGPQFSSREFQEFATDWQFDHQTSSPHYPQSNGKIENAVKSAKKLLIKAKASGQDPYLAILDWRNTPSTSIGTSPVQRLFGRRTKTLLPTAGKMLQPKIVEGTEEKLKERKSNQEHYYNRGTSLRASSPFGSHAIFILGEIYLGLARDLSRAGRGLGRGRGKESLPP